MFQHISTGKTTGKRSAIVGALDLNVSDCSNHLNPLGRKTIDTTKSLGDERIIEDLFNDGKGVDVQDGTCINKLEPMLVLCRVLNKGANKTFLLSI